MRYTALWVLLSSLITAGLAAAQVDDQQQASCEVSVLVLGVAQDGGKPQLGNSNDPAWQNQALQRLASSIALIDQRSNQTQRWLFDATPDLKQQLQRLDRFAPVRRSIGLDGIFLTHAHIGHYTGLMLLGHESVGANGIPVYAMPKMQNFLSSNGPWDQLIRYQNISLQNLQAGQPVRLAGSLSVTAFLVPHRQEYSEVVGFQIQGPDRSLVYLPDIDSWEQWDDWGIRIEQLIAANEIVLLDGSFYANGEIPGRDMSGFPHPFVTHSMQRFAGLSIAEKAKIHFIHMNHTNPLHDPDSVELKQVIAQGFAVSNEGQQHCL